MFNTFTNRYCESCRGEIKLGGGSGHLSVRPSDLDLLESFTIKDTFICDRRKHAAILFRYHVGRCKPAPIVGPCYGEWSPLTHGLTREYWYPDGTWSSEMLIDVCGTCHGIGYVDCCDSFPGCSHVDVLPWCGECELGRGQKRLDEAERQFRRANMQAAIGEVLE